MTTYFQKNGVPTLTVRELFDFITDTVNISKSTEEQKLDALILKVSSRHNELTEEEEIAEEVFKRSFIPQKLRDIVQYEKEADTLLHEEEGSVATESTGNHAESVSSQVKQKKIFISKNQVRKLF